MLMATNSNFSVYDENTLLSLEISGKESTYTYTRIHIYIKAYSSVSENLKVSVHLKSI
jgi:hypothetical protein